MSEWISVDDDFPEEGRGYLGVICLYYDGEVDLIDHEFVFYSGQGVFKKHRAGGFVALDEDEEITHWMELPTLPEPPQ